MQENWRQLGSQLTTVTCAQLRTQLDVTSQRVLTERSAARRATAHTALARCVYDLRSAAVCPTFHLNLISLFWL